MLEAQRTEAQGCSSMTMMGGICVLHRHPKSDAASVGLPAILSAASQPPCILSSCSPGIRPKVISIPFPLDKSCLTLEIKTFGF